jgi:general L-amino acid transport system permease protein
VTTAEDQIVVPGPEQEPGPPVRVVTPWEWARLNLFSSWFNTLLTVVFGLLLGWAAVRVVWFVLVTAEWEIVRRNLRLFMVGRYPGDELWRPWAATFLITALVGFALGVAGRVAADERIARGDADDLLRRGWFRRFWPLLLLVVILLAFVDTWLPRLLLLATIAVLLASRVAGTRTPRRVGRFSWLVVAVGLYAALQVLQGCHGCSWNAWGGLHLTLFVTVAGIVLAFPIGLVLALGRRSSLPAVRVMSIAYIEAFRGVPLISLLLMGQFVIGFFLPADMSRPGFVTRALIAIVIFESAYVAEVVRGGLQAVPRGQYEAGQAVGLSPWKVTRRIVLPQALRAVIPAMVGQFISLFKDTSLLAILGLFELLEVARTVTSQRDFLAQGLAPVTLAFAGFIYWVGSYVMSRESQALERRLGVGER